MCLNVVTRLQEDFLPVYQSIKRHSEFEEYFILDCYRPSYYCNFYIYTSLGHSMLVLMTNDTFVKSSMAPQAYKAVNTHAHEISVWKILSRLLHSWAPHLGGINGGVQSYLAIVAFKKWEQREDFHSRILRLQQEIMISGETLSTTRLIFRYMKALSKSDKPKALIAPKVTDIITFLDNNGKYFVYTRGYIHVIYS